MIYYIIFIPMVLGIAYYLWSAKYPELGEKLEERLEPVVQFCGYCLGIGIILVLLWGMFS